MLKAERSGNAYRKGGVDPNLDRQMGSRDINVRIDIGADIQGDWSDEAVFMLEGSGKKMGSIK